jgi:hypothetical protein
MKKLMWVLFVLASIVAHAADDETPVPTITSTAPNNARFEIVQSRLGAKATFKLDRYSGKVWQLVNGDNGTEWSPMLIEGMGYKGVASTSPRFQIFSSGLALRFTYLLDTQTGSCWELFSGSENKNDGWQLVEDAKLLDH